MEDEQTPPQVENYPIDEALIAILAEIEAGYRELSARRQGALVLFLRQHKLQGNWRVADNGRELVRQAEAPLKIN